MDLSGETKEEILNELVHALPLPDEPILVGPPVSTKSNYLCLFVTFPYVLTSIEEIPAYHDPLGVSNGEVSKVSLIWPKHRNKITLGVPVHDRVWKAFDAKKMRFGALPLEE